MLENNFTIENIYLEKNKLYFKMNKKGISKSISGIYIHNNKTRELNAIFELKDMEENTFKVNLEDLFQYLSLDEEFQIKSKIELIDEVYYLPIITTMYNIFPIEIYKQNDISLIIKKDKNNFLYFKKMKNFNCEDKDDITFAISNLDIEEETLMIDLFYVTKDVEINNLYLINRIDKKKYYIETIKRKNNIRIKIDIKIIKNKGIYDFEIVCINNSKKRSDKKRVNLLNDFRDIEEKYGKNYIKAYKTKDGNLAIYVDDKRELLKDKINDEVIITDIKSNYKSIFLSIKSFTNLDNEEIKIKSRNNFIRYIGNLINKKNNIYIFEFKINDLSLINGIYDFKIYNDEKPLSIINKNFIINPLYLFDNEKIARIRPYLTLDGNLALTTKNDCSLIADLKNVKISRKYMNLSFNIYNLNNNLKIKGIYIDDNKQLKYISENKSNFINNEIKIPLNFLKKLECQNYKVNYHLDIDGVNIITSCTLMNQGHILKNELIIQQTLDEKNIEIIANSNGALVIDCKNKCDIYLSNIKYKKKNYELDIEVENLDDKAYGKLKSLGININNQKIIKVEKKKLIKKNDNLYRVTLILKKDQIDFTQYSMGELLVIFNYEDSSISSNLICNNEKIIRKYNTFKSNARKISPEKYVSLYINTKNKKVYLEERALKAHEKSSEKIKFNSMKLNSNLFKKKSIWLVGENLGEVAQDNGFAFFKYCLDNNLKKDIYYVTKKDNKHMKYLKKYEKNLIYYDSYKHKDYYNKAEYLIVAHGIRDVMPSVLHNKIAFNNKDIIYLQHGIIAMKKVFFNKNSYNARIKKFIVCSDFEKEILIKKMNFKEEQVLVSGLSRFDYLEDKSNNNKYRRIIFMPTWRDWLVNSEEAIKNSKFYEGYKKLFTNKRFNEIIEKNNIQVDFIFHINMEKFKDQFDFITNNKNINLIDLRKTKISELVYIGDLWVTDYSSVVLDFNYLKKPSIFFQPDLEEYLVKRGSFVDFSNDLVGDQCINEMDFVNKLEEYIESDYTFCEKYNEISKKYYKYRDKKNSRRIYDAIVNLNS